MNNAPEVKVSVIVPTYRQAGRLRRLLNSLDKLEGAPPFEVIVIDDCSPDETQAVLEMWAGITAPFAKRYIRMPVNDGPAKARNKGAREARGELVAFVDADCIVDPGWLAALTARIDPEARIAGVGGRVKPLRPEGLLSRYYTEYGVLDPHPHLLYLASCNCCFLRGPLLEVGGFDEELPHAGGEDVGVCIKLWRRGWRFAFEPAAVVVHEYRESLIDFLRTMRRYGHGSSYVTYRYLGPEAIPVAGSRWMPGDAWDVNPLYWPRFRLSECKQQARHAMWLGVKKYGSVRVGLGLFGLRLLHLHQHRKGWREGEADARAGAAVRTRRI